MSEAKTYVKLSDEIVAQSDELLLKTLRETYSTNIVCMAQLASKCPIRNVAWTFKGKFVRDRFPSVIGNTTTGAWTVFDGGYVRSAGADTEESAETIIYQLGVPFGIFNFTIHNYVLATHTPFRVNLQKLHEIDQAHYSYAPDKFPGVIVRPSSEHSLTMSIFSSGTINIAGAPEADAGIAALIQEEPNLRKCRIYERTLPQASRWSKVSAVHFKQVVAQRADLVLESKSVQRRSKKNDRKRKRGAAPQTKDGDSSKRQKTENGAIAVGAPESQEGDSATSLLPVPREEPAADRQGLVHTLTLASRQPLERTYSYEWLRTGVVLIMDADDEAEADDAFQRFVAFLGTPTA